MSEQDTETQSPTDENPPSSEEVENCRSSGEYSLLGEVEFDFSGLPVSSDDSQTMDNVEEEEVFFGPVNFKEKLAVMAIEDTIHPADDVIDEDWEKIQQEAMNVVTAIKEATPLMPQKKTKRRFERVSPELPKPVKRIRKHSSPMLVELSPYDKMSFSPEKAASPERSPSPKELEKALTVKELPKCNPKYTLDFEAIENGTDPALQTRMAAIGGPSPAKQRCINKDDTKQKCVDKVETRQRFIDKSDNKESKMPMKRRSLQAPGPAAKFGFKSQAKSRQSVGAPRSTTPSSLNVSLQSQPKSGSKNNNSKKSDPTSDNNRHSKPQSPRKSQKPVSSLVTQFKPLVNKDTGKPQLRSSQTIPLPKTASNKEKTTPSVASAAAKERTGARRSLGSALQGPSTKVPACKSGLIKPGMLQQKSGLPRGPTKSSSTEAPSHKGPMKATLPMPSQLKKPSSIKKIVKSTTSRTSSTDITETPVKENKCVKPKQILSQTVTPPRQSENSDRLSTPASIKKSARKSLLPTPKKSVSSIGSADSSVFGRNGSSVSSVESFVSLDTPAKKTLGQSNPLTGKLIDLDINSPFKTRRTSVLHTPKNKENRIKMSAWSPVPRQKPISLEDEVIACTKRTAKLMK